MGFPIEAPIAAFMNVYFDALITFSYIEIFLENSYKNISKIRFSNNLTP